MRFLLLAPLAAALLCLKVAAAVNPYAHIAFPVLDNLDHTEKYFIDSCKQIGHHLGIEYAKTRVPLEIASAEFIKAFFNDRPEVVKALLEVKGVEQMASKFIIKSSMTDAVSPRVNKLETFFTVHESDQPRRDPTFDYMKSLEVDPPPQNDAAPTNFYARNRQYYFTFKGALALACHLSNSEMAKVLMQSSIFDDGLQDFCIRQLPKGAPENYPSGRSDAWRSRGGDDINVLFLALFERVSDFKLRELISYVVDDSHPELFESALKHQRFGLSLLPYAVISAAIRGTSVNFRRLLSKFFEPSNAVAQFGVHVVSYAAHRGDEFLTPLLEHIRWEALGESNRKTVVRNSIVGCRRPFVSINKNFESLKIPSTELIDILNELVEIERDDDYKKDLQVYRSKVEKYGAHCYAMPSSKQRLKGYLKSCVGKEA